MISSGIKRGLAASAVSALAVAGLPLLATSASAETGDVIQVGSVGPTLNGGGVGGVIVLKTKNITQAEAEGDATDVTATVIPALKLKNTTLTGPASDGSTQDVAIVGSPVFVASGATGDSNPTDGFAEVTLHVSALTPNAGDIAKYAVYLDDNDDNAVAITEARAQIQQTTSGPVAKTVVTPASQSTPQNVRSGKYSVTLQDSDGRTTQLNTGENVDPSSTEGTITFSPDPLSAANLQLGTATFTALPTATPTGTYAITLDGSGAASADDAASLTVTKAADLTNDNVDLVSGADTWDGLGDKDITGAATTVRVDQSTFRIDIKDSTPGGSVTVTATSSDVTFGGKGATTVSTVLDSNGDGSLTFTPDAGTIQAGDVVELTGSVVQTVTFDRSDVTAVAADSDPIYSKLKEATDVTATVVDQFGDPVTGGVVEAYRSAGPNAEAPSDAQRKTVGSDGKVTFTFTDAEAVLGQTDTIKFVYYVDQFATTGDDTLGVTHIEYTVDGMGSNFTTSLGGKSTEAADYDATKVQVAPLADASDDGGTDSAAITIAGGEASTPVKLSVEGALILKPGDTDLSKAVASVTATLDSSGDLALEPVDSDNYRVIGTTSGVATLTITSASRTETAQFTVANETAPSTARNVTVSGPAEVESGATQISYTAVITDAFGNPVANVPVNDLNIQVSGPAQFQDSGAVTDANGQISLNVRVDAGAEGDVKITVQGLRNQFGAAADQEKVGEPANGAKGLPVSANISSATTTVKGETPPPPPVDNTRTDITAHLSGHNNGARPDRLKVNGPNVASGAQVKLFKIVNGKKKLVDFSHLNKWGNHKFVVADRNGRAKAKYIARVVKTLTTWGDTTNKKRVR